MLNIYSLLSWLDISPPFFILNRNVHFEPRLITRGGACGKPSGQGVTENNTRLAGERRWSQQRWHVWQCHCSFICPISITWGHDKQQPWHLTTAHPPPQNLSGCRWVLCIMLDGKLSPTSFCSLTMGSMLIHYQTDALKATQPAEGK